MPEYLDFKKARCKDCYKCLRECPVKAIDVKDHQAKIIQDRCILCGRCTNVCPQNAKIVHSELDQVKEIISQGGRVIASVAPSFVSSFFVQDFSIFRLALGKLGFSYAEETAIGANAVVHEYEKLLKEGSFSNFITSACPAVCRMIQMYFPKALKYLAPVDSPMIAHAKILKAQYPDAKIIFLGPCIAKKREAAESGLIDAVLTFEELEKWFEEKGIVLNEITHLNIDKSGEGVNLAKYFPIRRGIIKSFEECPDGYEYLAVDGAEHCAGVLENIESLSGLFIEMNSCVDGCVYGPCSLVTKGNSVKAIADVRKYVRKDIEEHNSVAYKPYNIDFSHSHPRLRNKSIPTTDAQIEEILHKTGKFLPEDELNCGACGYTTCRQKAWAVFNGYADLEICLPFMRERAESMSYEVIQNSPEGLVILDQEMIIVDINSKAKDLLGIKDDNIKGRPASDYFNPSDFMIALAEQRSIEQSKNLVERTGKYVSLSITPIQNQKILFGIMKDVTNVVNYNDKLNGMRVETLATTDEVIKKQMRVAQEIASLLGETTAETKVALLKLKQTLQQEDKQEE